MGRHVLTLVTWVLLCLLGGPDSAATAAFGPLPDHPVLAVREALARTVNGSFHVSAATGEPGPPVEVALDLRRRALVVARGDAISAFRDGDHAYLRQEEPPPRGRPWLRFDISRVTTTGNMITGAYDLESWQAPLWLAGVVEATRTGPRTFSGTTDMRRGGPRHPGPAREEWEGRAKEVDNAAAVPFEAEVDGRGRLTRVTVRPEGGAPQTFVITRHGQRIELPHPRTGDVEIARDDVYG